MTYIHNVHVIYGIVTYLMSSCSHKCLISRQCNCLQCVTSSKYNLYCAHTRVSTAVYWPFVVCNIQAWFEWLHKLVSARKHTFVRSLTFALHSNLNARSDGSSLTTVNDERRSLLIRNKQTLEKCTSMPSDWLTLLSSSPLALQPPPRYCENFRQLFDKCTALCLQPKYKGKSCADCGEVDGLLSVLPTFGCC